MLWILGARAESRKARGGYLASLGSTAERIVGCEMGHREVSTQWTGVVSELDVCNWVMDFLGNRFE